jgi:hypothetical protein
LPSPVDGRTLLPSAQPVALSGTTPVKLIDLVLLVIIGCALVFLFWQLSELARYF